MEGLQPMLDTFLKDHPEMREEVARLIGYATGKLLGGDGETGSAVAWNGTKFNWLSHEQNEAYIRKNWLKLQHRKKRKLLLESIEKLMINKTMNGKIINRPVII